MKKLFTTATMFALASSAALADGKLNIYNWSDYIAEDTIANFEAETGIDVTYDVYDSNEVLEAKMLAGSSGYDIVVPTADFLARGREAGAYQDMDLSRLANAGNQNAAIQAQADNMLGTSNAGLVYMWGTTGIAYNEKMVQDRLGADAPTNSWSLVLDPKYASKLEDCGIAILDAPTDVLPNVIAYLGKMAPAPIAKILKPQGKSLTPFALMCGISIQASRSMTWPMVIFAPRLCGQVMRSKPLIVPKKPKTVMSSIT